MKSTLTQILSSGVTLCVSGFLFICCLFLLPSGWEGSRAGAVIGLVIPTARSTNCHWPTRQDFVTVTPTGFTFTDHYDTTAHGPHDFQIQLDIFHGRSGLWALTSQSIHYLVSITSDEKAPPSAAVMAAARSAFVDSLLADQMITTDIAATLRTTDTTKMHYLSSGLFHNCISLISFVLLTACIAIQRPWPQFIRATDSGHCSHCHYNLTGIPPSAPCPECGGVRTLPAV